MLPAVQTAKQPRGACYFSNDNPARLYCTGNMGKRQAFFTVFPLFPVSPASDHPAGAPYSAPFPPAGPSPPAAGPPGRPPGSVEAGDEIVASDTLYGCTFALLNHGMSKFGVGVKFVDFADLAAVKAALTEKTKVVYLETPCNPTLKVVDIAEVAKIAHEYNKNIRVIVDNTFCSPYIQQPLSLGADAVVHSAQKGLDKDEEDKKGRVLRQERYAGACSRSFYVGDVKAEDVKAKYESGVLTVLIPKKEPKKIVSGTSVIVE